MKIKTSEATGLVLDWLVAKCEGRDTRNNARVWYAGVGAPCDELLAFECMVDDYNHAREQCRDAYPGCDIDWVEYLEVFKPSTDWSQGGPLIDREITKLEDYGDRWGAEGPSAHEQFGPTALIAAMRCLVVSKLGDEVDVPEELLQ